MKLAYYIKKEHLKADQRVSDLLDRLEAQGHEVYPVTGGLRNDGTQMLLSIGGDGTFLNAARLVAQSTVPVLGVNFGRLGFLSENAPESIVEALSTGKYTIEQRRMLQVSGSFNQGAILALNEVSIIREGVSVIGIDVNVAGSPLPTYWADGIIVSTSSGSTAYNLSAGGPICSPDADVLVITPIAPHNLNVRPLVVRGDSSVTLGFRSRSGSARLTMDNKYTVLPEGSVISIKSAPSPLNVVRLEGSSFIGGLRSKLFWGEDKRNADNERNSE